MTHNPHTRLILSFAGLILIIGAILYLIHWSLTAVCILAVALMLLSFVAGWHTGYHDGRASSRRPTPRQQEQPAAIRIGGRDIPVSGRLVPRNEQVQA